MAAFICVNVELFAYSCGVMVYIVAIVLVSWKINLKAYGTENIENICVLGTALFFRNEYHNCCDG